MTLLSGKFPVKTAFPAWLWFLLLGFSLLHTTRIVLNPPGPDRIIDFRPVYLAQRLLVQGKDPYLERNIQQEWQKVVEQEGIASAYVPVWPLSHVIYPPWALSMLSWLSLFSYTVAYVLWYSSLPFLLSFILFAIARFSKLEMQYADLLLLSLAFKGTVASMLVGQPTFLSLALAFSALLAVNRRPFISGLLLGLAAFKVTVALPFVLFFIINKKFKALVAAGSTGAILLLISLVLSSEPITMLENYAANVSFMVDSFYDPHRPEYPLNYVMITTTEITALLEFLWRGSSDAVGPVKNMLLALLFGFIWWRHQKRKFNDVYLLLLLSAGVLLTTYHLFYDALLLLLLFPLSFQFTKRKRMLLLILLLPLFLPVNGLLDRLNVSTQLHFLYFSLPVVLLFLLIWLLVHPVYADQE
ncbi:MAG: glycosyltransferase family 87 protein [Bacteroidia bacterium]